MSPLRVRAQAQIALGLFLLVAAETLMFRAVEPVASWFYPCAWWSYILVVDGIVFLRQGKSLLISRPRELLVMVPWSVTFWLVFEMVNLRMENWHYVQVISCRPLRWMGYFVSYATVLPGIFESAELLGSLGLFARARTRPRVIAPFWFPLCSACGTACLVLPLLFPRYCYPLLWISFLLLLEPLNYVHQGGSLLREWEEGRVRKVLLLLTAGLLCGGLWEFWNFWAKTKWVYTVPFFDELKLFEMPVAGFLGFPFFAVECYVMYRFVSLFRFGRGWEMESSAAPAGTRVAGKTVVITAALMVLFYVLAFHAIDRHTVVSFATPSAACSGSGGK
jgi:hypothetical protein